MLTTMVLLPDALLPSEVARMVYGYLLEERCTEAAKFFLKESSKLEECRQVLSMGRRISFRFCQLTLLNVLEECCLVNTIVQEELRNFDKLDKLRHYSNLSSQLKILFEEYKSQSSIPTDNASTQSSPSLYESPRKFRKRRIFSNKEDGKSKKIAQELPEGSENHNSLDQLFTRSVEATPLKNLPGYVGEFEVEKRKKLNSNVPEQNLVINTTQKDTGCIGEFEGKKGNNLNSKTPRQNSGRSTPQKDTVSHAILRKENQNIQVQESQKDEILLRNRCRKFNKDLNFQSENLKRYANSEVQTELCSLTVSDKNVMTETEQKTCIDSEVQTSDIGSPQSEVEVSEILGNFSGRLVNQTGMAKKIADNINEELIPLKSKEVSTMTLIVELNKAVATAANKSENDPEMVDLLNALVLPSVENLSKNNLNLDVQCKLNTSSSQEPINSVSEESVSECSIESSIEKDVIISNNNVNNHEILENKNSDIPNTVNLKNSTNSEVNSSDQTVNQVDIKSNNIVTENLADISQIVSHSSQITSDTENRRDNTENVFISLDSINLHKKATNKSDVFTHNTTITSTPIKTFTAIENFDTCDWFSTQDLPMSNIDFDKEVSKCLTTTTSIYSSTQAITTNAHFLSPIAPIETNKIIENINCALPNIVKDQTLHTPEVLFPPKINTAVTINSNPCPMNYEEKNKTPIVQKSSEVMDQLLNIQSSQKSDKNLDHLSSELKDNNSDDCNKYFNVDSLMLFGVDNTINIPMPMHVQEIEIEDSITLTGTGLSPFLKVIKKNDITETSDENKHDEVVDNEMSKPNFHFIDTENKSIDNNISESKITENVKYTPTKILENLPKSSGKSLSTPKKPNSYVRALNFDTPINRSHSESKVNNTGLCLSPESLKRSLKNSCKSSLFQSPPVTNSETVEQKKNNQILLSIPEPTTPETKSLKKDSSLLKKESTVQPVVAEKKSWDSDLRKYLGKSEDESQNKKPSSSESSRKSHKKVKKDYKETPKKEKKSSKKSKKDENFKKVEIVADKKKEDIKVDKKKEEIEADKKKEEIKVDKKEKDIKVDKKKEDIKVGKKKEKVKADKKKEESKVDKKEEIKIDKKKDVKSDKKKEDITAEKKKEDIEADKKKNDTKGDKKRKDVKVDKRKEDIKTVEKKENVKTDKEKEVVKADKKEEESKDVKETSQIKTKIDEKTVVIVPSKESAKKEETEIKQKNRESKLNIRNGRKKDDVGKEEKQEIEYVNQMIYENEKINQVKEIFQEKSIKNKVDLNHDYNKIEQENLKESSIEIKLKSTDKMDFENCYSTNMDKIEPFESKMNVLSTEDESSKIKKDPLVILLSDSINDDKQTSDTINNEKQNIERLASEEMVNFSKLNNKTVNNPARESNDSSIPPEDVLTKMFENISDELTEKIRPKETALTVKNSTKDIDYAKIEEELSIIINEKVPNERSEIIYDEVKKVEQGKIVQKKYARLKTLDTTSKMNSSSSFNVIFDFEVPDKDEGSLQVPPTPQVLSPGSSSLMMPLSKMSEDSRTFPSVIATPLECPKTPNIVFTPVKDQIQHTNNIPQKSEHFYHSVIPESTEKPEITQFEVIKENLIKNSKPAMETSTKSEKESLLRIQAPMSYRENQDDSTRENFTSTSCSSYAKFLESDESEKVQAVENSIDSVKCTDVNSTDDSESDEDDDDNDDDDDDDDEDDDDVDDDDVDDDVDDDDDDDDDSGDDDDGDGDDDEEEEEDEEAEIEVNNQGHGILTSAESSPAKVFSINKSDKELADTVQETPAKDSSCNEVDIFETPNVSKPVEPPTNLNAKITEMIILKDRENRIIEIRPKPKIICVKRVLPRVVMKPSSQLIKALPKNQPQASETESMTQPSTSHRLRIEKSEEEIALAIKSIENDKFNRSQDEQMFSNDTPSPANKSFDKDGSNKSELAHAIESLTRTETDTIEKFGVDKKVTHADDDCSNDGSLKLVLEDNSDKDEENSMGQNGSATNVQSDTKLNDSHSHNTRFQTQQKNQKKLLGNSSAQRNSDRKFEFDEETYKRKRRKHFSSEDLQVAIRNDKFLLLVPTNLDTLLDIKPKRKKPVRKTRVKKEKCPKLDVYSDDSMPTQMLNTDSESIPVENANTANDEADNTRKRTLEEGELLSKKTVKRRKRVVKY